MLLEVEFENCFAFNEKITFSMQADMRTKRLPYNVLEIKEHIDVLKSAVIYGPNNTGKTNFVTCMSCLKSTLLNRPFYTLKSNVFNEKNTVSIVKLKLLCSGNVYTYMYKYDTLTNEYLYEEFSQIITDKHGNETFKNLLLRDCINNNYKSIDKKLEEFLPLISKNNIIIYSIEEEKFDILKTIKTILFDFGSKLVILDMNRINENKTIMYLKRKDDKTKKMVELIKNADLYLDDYYIDDESINESLNNFMNYDISKKIVSVYKNKSFSSYEYDSVGTKKFASLASYIIDAIEKGKILIIDEIDSSLHFKLTRAIVSLFNNSINTKAQLICTSHDISLLDCKYLFRKEQIWFTNKTDTTTELYSLKKFNSNDDGIRENSDLISKYEKGFFASIPEPNLIEGLYEE